MILSPLSPLSARTFTYFWKGFSHRIHAVFYAPCHAMPCHAFVVDHGTKAMYVGQQRWRQGQGDPEALRKTFSKVPFGRLVWSPGSARIRQVFGVCSFIRTHQNSVPCYVEYVDVIPYVSGGLHLFKYKDATCFSLLVTQMMIGSWWNLRSLKSRSTATCDKAITRNTIYQGFLPCLSVFHD